MKRILILVLVLILVINNQLAKAQCVNEISTDPTNPVNTQFDGIPQYSGLNNMFLNNTYISKLTGASFDSFLINSDAAWDYPNIFTNGQDLPMSAPYDNANLSAVNPGSYDHILIPFGNPEERDYHWEDGWELLYLNTGFYPDGQRIDVADPQSAGHAPCGTLSFMCTNQGHSPLPTTPISAYCSKP